MFIRFVLTIIVGYASSQVSHASEKSEAFEVKALSNRYRVIAPLKYHKDINLILENSTMVNIFGKVMTKERGVIEHLSVLPGKFKRVELNLRKNEVPIFVPLSPPFQEIKLIIGRRPYEIPPKE
jgi:hypothetical protein